MGEETATYDRVTAEQIRQHGVCKGKHKGLGYWKLLCGCMTHPKGVSVIRVNDVWHWKRKQARADLESLEAENVKLRELLSRSCIRLSWSLSEVDATLRAEIDAALEKTG